MEVLKRELVQVQTLMDNMTREREEESARLKNEYEQLQRNFTTSEVHIQHRRGQNFIAILSISIYSAHFILFGLKFH